jgi:hypothetical protein
MEMRRIRRTAVLTLLALPALLSVGAGSGAAASSDGATLVQESGCVTYTFGTVCDDVRLEYNVTRTPSGNIIWEANSSGSQTYTAPSCSIAHDVRTHDQYLYDAPVMEEHHISQQRESRFDCPALGLTVQCTVTSRLHFTSGEVQFDEYEQLCNPL